MTLTSFLKDPEVKEYLKKIAEKPRFKERKDILVASLSEHPQLIGTAFDYLLRFYIKNLNPDAVESEWAAYHGFNIIKNSGDKELSNTAQGILFDAKANYSNYKENGIISENLIISALKLAQLEVIHRSRGIIPEQLGEVHDEDIIEMNQLISIVRPSLFKSNGKCYLNPGFFYASHIIGGADADLIIDNMLIDIKTTIKCVYKREYFNQLIGYLALLEIDKTFLKKGNYLLRNDPSNKWVLDCRIEKLGIYYSRFGELTTVNVRDIFPSQKSLWDFSNHFKDFIDNKREELGLVTEEERIEFLLHLRKYYYPEEYDERLKQRGLPLVKGRYKKTIQPTSSWLQKHGLWDIVQSIESTRPPMPNNNHRKRSIR